MHQRHRLLGAPPARQTPDQLLSRPARWIEEHHKAYRALYRRASRLFDELALTQANGSYARLLGRIASTDVFVLDDLGLVPIREPEHRHLLEIMDDRHGSRSTIVTSQLPVEKWHDYTGDPMIADAVSIGSFTTLTVSR